MVFLTYDGEHHRIALMEIPELVPKNQMSGGLDHVVFTFESLTDPLTAYTQRKALGILPM